MGSSVSFPPAHETGGAKRTLLIFSSVILVNFHVTTTVDSFTYITKTPEQNGDSIGEVILKLHLVLLFFNDIISPTQHVVHNLAQPVNTAGTSQPHEVHTGATNGNGGSAARPNSSTPPIVAATSTDGAPPNAANSMQGYVTMADLIAFLDRERFKHGATPFQFVRDPSYPKEILSRPYPKKYESLAFLDLALDCYGGHAESFLVEICINNMFPKYRAVLENIRINQFARLLDATKRTAISAKAISTGKFVAKSTEKKIAAHTLAVSIQGQGQGQKMRDRDMALPPPIPLIVEELDVLLDKWIDDGDITLPQTHRESSDDDKRNPKYCRYHHFVHHVTTDCFSLRRMYHRRVSKGLLEVPNKRQRVDEDPLPRHNQGTINVFTHVESIGASEPIVEFLDNTPSFSVRRRATKAILSITNEAGGECLNAEAHASRAYLESSNVVTFTDEDMEASYLDHRKPFYLSIHINAIDVRRALGDTSIDERSLSNRIECLALKASNEILAEHLDFSDEANHLIPPKPTLHKAQPTLTSLEPLEAVDLGDDPTNPKHVHISTTLTTGLDPTLVAHSLNVDPSMKCCVDFRDLNKACPKDEFSVPNMDVSMDNTTGCEMYSLIDSSSGYNQVSMCPSDAEKTAFRTPIGNFFYIVMPFGLKNVGATYQRVMVAIFHDFIHIYIEVYIDDIVVKSEKRLGHFDVLRKVFNKCHLYKLKKNPVKCASSVSAGKFLGLLVSKHGISVDPAKSEAIRAMQPPKNLKQL
ncbi:hypothetical protein SLEP1_g19004 [Rubroshorea leprosula]|nr:hypothetical protein SLEP1_g19004 [Rubroshorea leprosula]